MSPGHRSIPHQQLRTGLLLGSSTVHTKPGSVTNRGRSAAYLHETITGLSLQPMHISIALPTEPGEGAFAKFSPVGRQARAEVEDELLRRRQGDLGARGWHTVLDCLTRLPCKQPVVGPECLRNMGHHHQAR